MIYNPCNSSVCKVTSSDESGAGIQSHACLTAKSIFFLRNYTVFCILTENVVPNWELLSRWDFWMRLSCVPLGLNLRGLDKIIFGIGFLFQQSMSPWFKWYTPVSKACHSAPPASQSAEWSPATSEVTDVTARSPWNPGWEPQLRFSICLHPQGYEKNKHNLKKTSAH